MAKKNTKTAPSVDTIEEESSSDYEEETTSPEVSEELIAKLMAEIPGIRREASTILVNNDLTEIHDIIAITEHMFDQMSIPYLDRIRILRVKNQERSSTMQEADSTFNKVLPRTAIYNHEDP